MLLNHEEIKNLNIILSECQESLSTELDMIDPEEENIEEHSRLTEILENIAKLQTRVTESLKEFE
jgi:hypothetical protein